MLVSSVAAIGKFVRRLRKDQSGVTAIEYGLIAGAIAVAIIATVTLVGTDLNNKFTTIQTCLSAAGCPNNGG